MNSDYTTDSTEHHLSDALVIRRELVENSSAGSAIDRTLQTSVDTTLNTCLKAVGNEVSHSRKNVKTRVNEMSNESF